MTLFDQLRGKYGETEWCVPILDAVSAVAPGEPLHDWLLVERYGSGFWATWHDDQELAVDQADRAGWDGVLVPVAQLLRGET